MALSPRLLGANHGQASAIPRRPLGGLLRHIVCQCHDSDRFAGTEGISMRSRVASPTRFQTGKLGVAAMVFGIANGCASATCSTTNCQTGLFARLAIPTGTTFQPDGSTLLANFNGTSLKCVFVGAACSAPGLTATVGASGQLLHVSISATPQCVVFTSKSPTGETTGTWPLSAVYHTEFANGPECPDS